MYTYVLWRLVNNKWRVVRGVYSKNISCCSKYETVLPIGIDANYILIK
ncbi:MAG TPA: hypothetical protein GXZ90_00395 [Clostridiales bacterium]|nr:hypothetical protein [Clostridiales bacterium]